VAVQWKLLQRLVDPSGPMYNGPTIRIFKKSG
jgi:hypothetical protein